jgi:hypothetical protein
VKSKLIVALTAVAIAVIVLLSLFLMQNWFSENRAIPREFYVGVMFAYDHEISQVKALVDRVKNYTNLFVLGSVDLFNNETALTEACDYIADANLNFMVQFRGLDTYVYNITDWMQFAHARYGSQFLGIYRYDEPGGRQLDGAPDIKLINSTAAGPNPTYASVKNTYVGNLSYFPGYYLQFTPQMFTADYALYWYTYQAGYSSVFAEFVGNESRERHIALCRGAADTYGRDWGVIVTWKYNQPPYLESGTELYNDLALAYSSGAKYTVVFSYPETGQYGTLTEEHFLALERFWKMLYADPSSFGKNSAEAAYVVPADYGFGFRSPTDTIWGLFPPDNHSAKIYDDIKSLTERFGARLDILYDGPEAMARLGNYTEVYYWNQTIS